MFTRSLVRIAPLIPFYLVSFLILFVPLGSGTAGLSPYDTFIHAGLFAMLGIATFFVIPEHITADAWALVVYAAYSEVIQSFIPTRTTDLRDIFNDCLGILAALIVINIARRYTNKKVATRTTRRTK